MRHCCARTSFPTDGDYRREVRSETFEFRLPDPLLPDSWIEVTRGGLPQVVKVQIAMVNGSPIVRGLRIDNPAGVTSRTVRAVTVGRLLLELGAHLVRELQRLTEEAVTDPRAKEILDNWVGPAGLPPSIDRRPVAPRGRGAKPPTVDELRRFAETLTGERARAQRGAVTRASREMGMSRSTAHRWINICKQQGLLHDEENL